MEMDMEKIFKRKPSPEQKKALQWLFDQEVLGDGVGIFNDDDEKEEVDMILPLLYLIAFDRYFMKGEIPDPKDRKQTLVVVTDYAEWLLHLSRNTLHGGLNFYFAVDAKTSEYCYELLNSDIVITDYDVLAVTGLTKVKCTKWWRIILYSPFIGAATTPSPIPSLIKLEAKRRWAVTYQPIQNEHLGFLLPFFRFEPFYSGGSRFMQWVLNEGQGQGQGRTDLLKVILESISFLPPKFQENHYIELSVEERNKYNWIKEEADVTLTQYNKDKNDGLLPYLESLIISLRQVCTHMALCSPDLKRKDFEDVSSNPKLMQELITVLKADDPCCTICTSPLTDTRALITICSHVFCRKCIRKALIDKPICPLCRNHLSEADMFSAAPPGSSSNIDSSSARSTKVEALRNLLVENTVAKSVVFSQYTMMLSSLEEILRDAGFKTLHLYRRKDDSNKARVIEQFQTLEEDRPMVLLVSIRAAKENLDLRAASRVYLMEACKKKAEKRAVRCVYQFGQRKNVKIVRLIAKDSIEEKILELHEKKISSSPSGSTVRWCADRIGLNETQFILEE